MISWLLLRNTFPNLMFTDSVSLAYFLCSHDKQVNSYLHLDLAFTSYRQDKLRVYSKMLFPVVSLSSQGSISCCFILILYMKKPELQEVKWFTQTPIAFQCSTCLYHGLKKKSLLKRKKKTNQYFSMDSNILSSTYQYFLHWPGRTWHFWFS